MLNIKLIPNIKYLMLHIESHAFSRVASMEKFFKKNNHCTPHKVLTIKNNDEQQGGHSISIYCPNC